MHSSAGQVRSLASLEERRQELLRELAQVDRQLLRAQQQLARMEARIARLARGKRRAA